MDKIEITPELLAELKEKAEKATPGPWERFSDSPASGEIYAIGGNPACGYTDDDAEYIAAANPQVVLSLIARIEELEKKNSALQISNAESISLIDSYEAIINWICLALGSKIPKGIMKDGGRHVIERIKEIKAHYRGLLLTVDRLANEIDENDEITDEEKARLEKEADWLATELEKREHGCEWCGKSDCSRYTSPCGYTGPDNWREAARKAVKEMK